MTHRSPYHMFVKSVRAALAIAVGATLAAPVGASAAPVAMERAPVEAKLAPEVEVRGDGVTSPNGAASSTSTRVWVLLLTCFVVVPIMAIAVIPAMAGIMGVIKSPLWKRQHPCARSPCCSGCRCAGRSER